jgi:hypothetical protein
MHAHERFSSPVWSCFRQEVRRRWRGRSAARALVVLVCIIAIQGAVTIMALRSAVLLAGRGWMWTLSAAQVLGLWSPIGAALATPFQAQMGQMKAYLLLDGVLMRPWVACHFLMPAFAAHSIAPDRERHRIPDLLLAGMTPRQILLAKGMASVLPFLLSATLGAVASFVHYALVMHGKEPLYYPYPYRFSAGLMFLIRIAVPMTLLLLNAAVQVCISALSRRTLHALVLGYTLSFLLPVIQSASWLVWSRFVSVPNGTTATERMWLGVLLVETLPEILILAATLLWLWRRALRSLAYPEDAPGRPLAPTADPV